MENNPTLRIQKYLAERGICSRRQAEVLIEDGLVTVNGNLAQIGQKVDPVQDRISVEGRKVKPHVEERVTLMMNKPKGVLCSNFDPYHTRTVFDLLPKPYNAMRLFCAGRLDKDSEGLLILTNDGTLSNRITHPSVGVIKRYYVKLHKDLDVLIIPKLLKGVRIEGELLFARKIIMAKHGPDKERRLEVHLEQGRKREIRRLFESFGYYVKRLQRFQIGKLVLKKVPSGKARPLTIEELNSLFKK